MRKLALVFFLAGNALGVAHADDRGIRPGQGVSTGKLNAAYEKSYLGLSARTSAAHNKLRAVDGALSRLDSSDRDDMKAIGTSKSHDDIVAKRRAALVAAEVAQLERLRTARDATLSGKWHSLVRNVRHEERAPLHVDESRIDGQLSLDNLGLQRVESAVQQIDAKLAVLPAHVRGDVKVGSGYGSPRVADLRIYDDLRVVGDRYEKELPQHKLRKLERVLLGRITDGVKRDQAAFRDHLATAPVEALHAEANEIMQLFTNLSSAREMRRVPVGESYTQLDMKAKYAKEGLLSKEKGSTGVSMKSESHEDAVLANGADYHLQYKSTSIPLVESGGRIVSMTGETPVQTRALLEQGVRLQEIYRTLRDRAPQLAAHMTDWMQVSRIVVDVPVALHAYAPSSRPTIDHASGFSTKPVYLSMTGIKADLLQLEGGELLDAERADMLKAELNADKSKLLSSY